MITASGNLPDNLRLLCRKYNKPGAERAYGKNSCKSIISDSRQQPAHIQEISTCVGKILLSLSSLHARAGSRINRVKCGDNSHTGTITRKAPGINSTDTGVSPTISPSACTLIGFSASMVILSVAPILFILRWGGFLPRTLRISVG